MVDDGGLSALDCENSIGKSGGGGGVADGVHLRLEYFALVLDVVVAAVAVVVMGEVWVVADMGAAMTLAETGFPKAGFAEAGLAVPSFSHL